MIYKLDKQNLVYKRITGKIIFLVLITTAVLSGTLTVVGLHQAKKITYISAETKAIVLAEHNEFNLVKLKEYIKELNIRYPDIALAQAEIESGMFTSQLFKENHNLYGMKFANQRPSTMHGEENGYAYYETWKESVEDYAFYQATCLNNIKTEKDYLEYLRQNYAEDTLYVTKIEAKLKEFRANE